MGEVLGVQGGNQCSGFYSGCGRSTLDMAGHLRYAEILSVWPLWYGG